MKHFSLLTLVVAAGTLAAGAYTAKSGDVTSFADKVGNSVAFKLDGSQHAPLKTSKCKVFGKLPSAYGLGAKAPSRAAESFNVITEPPTGKSLTFCGSSFSFYIDYGEVMQDEWAGLAYDAVVTDGGEFYLKNPVSSLQWDTYIKGTVSEDGITFEFPQPLYRFDDEEEGALDLYADVLEYVEIETPYGEYINTFVPAENTRTITFEKDEDGNYVMDPDFMLGVTYNGTWQGYGEYNLVLRPFEADITVVPESVKFDDTYVLADEILGWDHTILRPMMIGFDGNDAYLKGISLAIPDAVIKGTVDPETKSISIPTNQFMGRFYNYYIFMMNGDGNEYYDEFWEEDMIEILFIDNDIVLNFDAETNVYTPVTEADHFAVILFNFGNTMENPCEYYAVDRIYSQGEITDYAPVAPVIEDVYSVSAMDPEYSYCLEFELFADNKEGQMLQDANIYYNIFINGELYPLTVEEFPMLAYFGIDAVTDVPASLSDNEDIYASGNFHGIAFRNKNIKTLGVRAVYINGDIRGESEIVTVEVSDQGVEDILNDKGVKSIEYFDMAGRRLTSPVKGAVMILRTTLNDGTVITDKKINR